MNYRDVSYSNEAREATTMTTKKIFLALFVLACVSVACEQKNSLYEGIPTEVVAIAAHSHSAANYQPVPDSLQLRFNSLLRLLRINVVSEGCGPNPKAKLTAEEDRIIVQFDMENSCVHVVPEYFDVDLSLSPIHPDVFQLIVEEKDFEQQGAGKILLQRRIDVRELPGL
jgi:hypothetical protein